MAENSRSEMEYASTDPVGAANSTNHAEPVATEPIQYVESTSGESDRSRSELDSEKKQARPTTHRTTTEATTASSFTVETRNTVQPKAKKPWYKRMNPLKWGKKPPVPKERIVSREYGANFFSKLTWQWMAPLMAVREPSPHSFVCVLADICSRLDTNAHWN